MFRPLVVFALIFESIVLVKSTRVINITVMAPGITAIYNILQDLKLSEDEMVYQPDYSDYSEGDTGENYVMGDYDYLSACTSYETLYERIQCFEMGYNFYPWSYPFIKPALDLAMEEIKASGIAGEFDIQLQYRDCSGEHGYASSRVSQIASVDARMEDKMGVMIGPMSSYATSRVAAFTTHWNILHVSPRSISSGLRKNDHLINTLVRTGPVATEVGNCVSSVLQYYGWHRTCVEVFEDDLKERPYYFLAEGIYEGILQNSSDHIVDQIRLSEFPSVNQSTYSYTEVLMSVREFGRIIVLSAADHVVREFLRQADEHEYSNKNFAYVIIDLEDKLGPTPWMWTDHTGTFHNDSAVRRGLESSLIIRLQKEESKEYEHFVKEIVSRLGKNMMIENEDEDIVELTVKAIADQARYQTSTISEYFQKNLYPAIFHDTLLMVADILNKSIDDVITARFGEVGRGGYTEDMIAQAMSFALNGTRLMENYIAGKSFKGVTGKMSMNNNGDRKIDFDILDLDPVQGQFVVVGEYNSDTEFYRELPKMAAHWPSGTPPPDVPVCGFSGGKCKKQRLTVTEAVVISVVSLAAVVAIVSINAYRKYKLTKELQSQLWRVLWCDITWVNDGTSNMANGPTPGVFGGGADYRVTPQTPRRNNTIDFAGSDLSLAEVMSFAVPPLTPTVSSKRNHRRPKKFRSRKWSNRVDDAEQRKTSSGSLISDRTGGTCTTLGMYKGKLVMIKLTNRKKVELTRSLQMELKHMRDITHDHLTRFEGACVDPPRICVLTEYCPKGSLRDILLNDEIQLDWMFRYSLMNDVVKGMSFLHGSAIHSHGNLKSTNCVVDSRFVLKITDYGLASFRSVPCYEDFDQFYAKQLWTAPELLRMASAPPSGTQKGDVYSFGVILHEIALRKGTFYVEGMQLSAKEIFTKVRNGYYPYFRPSVDFDALSEGFCHLLQRCWSEDPAERPDFTESKEIIKRFNKGNPGNLLDSLLSRMEQYATNLEGLVEERTAAYLEEKRKADDLLYQMLPVPVVHRLKRGDAVPAEAYESVTIFFSDIVGFTQLSATSTPMQVVDMLNDLYTCFDAIIDNFDVYKVETIGDAYMLVSGLPERNGIRHAAEIARTSLALLSAVNSFKIRHRNGEQIKLRIGIHSGPCCAGVVGLKMPRYCLFGDTVNTASRMESNGLPLLIHVSQSTKNLLDRFGSFHLELRGEIELKGKGKTTTYWLLGENPLVIEEISAEENESQV
uniref:atrial natriuretic peptide receptor 1-like isoform X1 n=1 Tax=Styela clava TaxID=7725 RepID=UPI0019395FF1|nr:atrial natriuretic peptide receptor 1-like isoform X1 [Styela clava]